jgi:hypothetical protein
VGEPERVLEAAPVVVEQVLVGQVLVAQVLVGQPVAVAVVRQAAAAILQWMYVVRDCRDRARDQFLPIAANFNCRETAITGL